MNVGNRKPKVYTRSNVRNQILRLWEWAMKIVSIKWVVFGVTGVLVAVASVPAAQAVFRTLRATGAVTFVDPTAAVDVTVGDRILAQAIFDDSLLQPDGRILLSHPGHSFRVDIDNVEVASAELDNDFPDGPAVRFDDGINAISFDGFGFLTDVCGSPLRCVIAGR